MHRKQGDPEACDRNNADIDAILNLHHDTPAPSIRPRYDPGEFLEAPPSKPIPIKPRWWLSWLKSHVAAVSAQNEHRATEYELAHQQWEARKSRFDDAQLARKKFIEEEMATNPDARERWIEEQLAAIVWPRETLVAYELDPPGHKIVLDVDLPEMEDMPSRTARPAERGFKVVHKPFGQRASEHNYARHVHALLFRLIGEMYSALPSLDTVVVSGYTQRSYPGTGHVEDQYVLSVWTTREQWLELNFEDMAKVDPVAAIARFEHRRDMTATGKLKAIEPFAAIEA